MATTQVLDGLGGGCEVSYGGLRCPFYCFERLELARGKVDHLLVMGITAFTFRVGRNRNGGMDVIGMAVDSGVIILGMPMCPGG
jgi:hypothetical protein